MRAVNRKKRVSKKHIVMMHQEQFLARYLPTLPFVRIQEEPRYSLLLESVDAHIDELIKNQWQKKPRKSRARKQPPTPMST
jgi:hypothetical protein